MLLFALFDPRVARAAETASSAIATAEDAVLRGDYEKARQLAAPLKDHADLPREQKARFFLLQARIADAYEDFDGEKSWLQKLNNIAPETQLDRYRDPPTLFRAWSEIKAVPAPVAATPAAIGRPPVWTVYAPFGIGHFIHDDERGGARYLAGDLLALYLSIGASERIGAGGGLVMIGIYGHEMINAFSLRGSTYSGEQVWAKRAAMAFPFGVGQARNGDLRRAAYFAGAQTLALVAAASKDTSVKTVGWTAFFAAYGYGVLDSWLRMPRAAEPTTAWHLQPWVPEKGSFGARLVFDAP